MYFILSTSENSARAPVIIHGITANDNEYILKINPEGNIIQNINTNPEKAEKRNFVNSIAIGFPIGIILQYEINKEIKMEKIKAETERKKLVKRLLRKLLF